MADPLRPPRETAETPDMVEMLQPNGSIVLIRRGQKADYYRHIRKMQERERADAAEGTTGDAFPDTLASPNATVPEDDVFQDDDNAMQGVQVAGTVAQAIEEQLDFMVSIRRRRARSPAPTGAGQWRPFASRDRLRAIAAERSELNRLANEEAARTRPARLQDLADETARERAAYQARWLRPSDRPAATASGTPAAGPAARPTETELADDDDDFDDLIPPVPYQPTGVNLNINMGPSIPDGVDFNVWIAQNGIGPEPAWNPAMGPPRNENRGRPAPGAAATGITRPGQRPRYVQ